MTVQELFAKVNRAELADRLSVLRDRGTVEQLLDDLEDIAAYGKDNVLIDFDVIRNVRFGRGGPVSLAEWGVTLGAEIDNSLLESMTEAELSAKILTEMIENGISEDEQYQEITRLLDGGSLAI